MTKRILFLLREGVILLVLFLNVEIYAQSYWSIDFTPRVTTTILNENGMIPDNVNVIKHTPSYSLGVQYGYQISKNKTIGIGINRYANSYKTVFQSDYIPNKKWYFKAKNTLSIFVNEPIISLSFNEIRILNSRNNTIKVGISYDFFNTLNAERTKRYINESPNGQLDTIYWKSTIQDNNPIRIKLIAEYTRTFKLIKERDIFLDIGFNFRLSESDSKVYNTIVKGDREYQYSNLYNSSGIGFIMRINYYNKNVYR